MKLYCVNNRTGARVYTRYILDEQLVSGYKWIHLAVTTILSPIQDTCRRRQVIQMVIQVDTNCIRAIHVSGVNAARAPIDMSPIVIACLAYIIAYIHVYEV